MTTRILGLIITMLALAASAQAQTSSDGLLKVKPGTTIIVTTLEGEEIKGLASAPSPNNVTVWTKAGQRVVALADIRKVQKPDGTGNGAATGAALGLLSVLTDNTEDDPMVPEALNTTINVFAAATAVTLCALAGWAVDSLIKKRKTIYAAKAPQLRSRASLVVKGRMVGVSIAF